LRILFGSLDCEKEELEARTHRWRYTKIIGKKTYPRTGRINSDCS
jgi:hypothetical protein